MLTRLLLPAIVGFVAGVAWLMFAGVPFLMPSWLHLHDQVQAREAAAAGHAEAFDVSEGLRSDENREAIGNVEGERGACTERLTEMRRVYERQIDRLLERSDDASCPDPRGVRRIERVPDNAAAVGTTE